MTLKRRTVVITLSAIAGLSCYGIIMWDASAMSDVISWVKKDSSQNDADEIQKKAESKTRKKEANEIEKKPMLELSRKEVAELEEVTASARKKVENAIAVWDKLGATKFAGHLRTLLEAGRIIDALELAGQQLEVWNDNGLEAKVEEFWADAKRQVEQTIEVFDKLGETKNAEKLRGLLEAGKIRDATELAGQQLLVWAEKRPDPWSRSELSPEVRDEMLFKASIFGVSFEAVVAYEMARARVPTSRILTTMKTYHSLDDSLLRQIDRISKHVDDQHLHYRLWKLSSAIDDILSKKASGR